MLGFFRQSGFTLVPVTSAHVVTLKGLPRHHEDHFDRLLVATALTEPYRFVTHERRLAA